MMTHEVIPGDGEAPTIGLLDATGAARYLSLSESYIRKAVANRRIPFVRIGKRTLFRRSDLDGWIEAHLIRSNSEVQSDARAIARRTIFGGRQ